MVKHISRKELKKDALRETLGHGADAVAAHQRLTWILLYCRRAGRLAGRFRLALLQPAADRALQRRSERGDENLQCAHSHRE